MTLGWLDTPPPGEASLVLENFDAGGSLSYSKPTCALPVAVDFYFGQAPSTGASLPAGSELSIDGSEIAELLSASGAASDRYARFTDASIKELSRRTGISNDKMKEALGNIKLYRIRSGLLQRSIVKHSTGLSEFNTVVPEGNWRTVEFGAAKQRLTLRRYVITIFHCTPVLPHHGRDKTVSAIKDAGLWWQGMRAEIGNFIRGCLVCHAQKSTPLISGHQHSREYDGPFHMIITDFVGPKSPPSRRGHRYMFTAICPFSGWYWAIPCEKDTSDEAARCLFYHVMCNLAGYPLLIGSDRAQAFVEGVVRSMASYMGIHQVIGTAYHPETQGAVERPHRTYSELWRTFMDSIEDWDLTAMIFVWTVRTSTKVYDGRFTPYEIVTGMRPRCPLDAVLTVPSGVERLDIDTYVRELIAYVKHVHTLVSEAHLDQRQEAQDARYRNSKLTQTPSVGEYCFVSRVKDEVGTSRSFQSRAFDTLFQVVERIGDPGEAKAYVVADLECPTENLGFSQSVSYQRIIPAMCYPLHDPMGMIALALCLQRDPLNVMLLLPRNLSLVMYLWSMMTTAIKN